MILFYFLTCFVFLCLLIIPWLKGLVCFDEEIKRAIQKNKALQAKRDKEAREALAEKINEILNEQEK